MEETSTTFWKTCSIFFGSTMRIARVNRCVGVLRENEFTELQSFQPSRLPIASEPPLANHFRTKSCPVKLLKSVGLFLGEILFLMVNHTKQRTCLLCLLMLYPPRFAKAMENHPFSSMCSLLKSTSMLLNDLKSIKSTCFKL